MQFHDPNGKVFCDTCSTLGKPKGGVKTERLMDKVHIHFSMPEGWALAADGSLLCGGCAPKEEPLKPVLSEPAPTPAKGRKVKRAKPQAAEVEVV